MTAQILLHPKLPQVVSLIDVVRKFNALGYALSNTRARNIEAVRVVLTVARPDPPHSAVLCEASCGALSSGFHRIATQP